MKIGFVDYDLNNFHANKFLSLYRHELQDQNIEVAACYGLLEGPSKAWAEQNGIPWSNSPEAVAEQVDALVILSPDNAEFHLPLAQRTLPAGKPTFMDKTFADTYEHAVAIAELAEQHKTPFFSSSSLRFAAETERFFAEAGALSILDCASTGPGPWDRYGVHTVEPLIAIMGADVRRLRADGTPNLMRVTLEWNDGRTGHVTVNGLGAGNRRQGWQITLSAPEAVSSYTISDPTFYLNLQKAVLTFFQTGRPPVAMAETLMIMAILTQAEAALGADRWVTLP